MINKILTLCGIFFISLLTFNFVKPNHICENHCPDSPYIIQDLETCGCYCFNHHVKCPQNQYWNEEKCDCICKEVPRNCKLPYVWSKNLCKCLCPETKNCKGNQVAVKPNCKCECPNNHEMEACFKEDVLNSWNKTSCECFFNPLITVFGNLFDKGFTFTNFVKTMFNSNDYGEE
ncbi:hypothetical protein PVAND_017523 [Polypedilum vanderplanki]|uniref:Uncharacterized protein n=1 Tax=Polypedilum vanderplanki TaxID=319348 RepID=A0A9J6BJA7_POLVA|nr:hypothetical protein PVAND_017523 [Polypedilum vanderplanki]